MALNLGLSYLISEAGMDALYLAPISQEAADALSHEDYDFTMVHEYSDLDYSRFEGSVNLDILLNTAWGLYFGFLYDYFDDNDPYLTDTTGTYYSVYGGFRAFF